MSDTKQISSNDVKQNWLSGEIECRRNWAKAAQLPDMPSELMLIAKDRLIGKALADWTLLVCETVVPLRKSIADLERQLAKCQEENRVLRDLYLDATDKKSTALQPEPSEEK